MGNVVGFHLGIKIIYLLEQKIVQYNVNLVFGDVLLVKAKLVVEYIVLSFLVTNTTARIFVDRFHTSKGLIILFSKCNFLLL